MYRHSLLGAFLLGALCNSLAAQNPSYVLTSINAPFPGTVQTIAHGINDSGAIVGSYSEPFGEHGFLLRDGVFTPIDFPGTLDTIAFGINARGDIVGRYEAAGRFHGFLLRNGKFSTLDAPCSNVVDTLALGINDEGQIVGLCYTDNGNGQHGFLLDRGNYSIIDVPGSQGTAALGINSRGQIVGYYGKDGLIRGFIKERGAFATIPFASPGDAESIANGINNRGQVAAGGLIFYRGVLTPFEPPGAPGANALGINARGQIVGIYGSDELSFLASPL
jgi:probable HAF family extracellular repeat protein